MEMTYKFPYKESSYIGVPTMLFFEFWAHTRHFLFCLDLDQCGFHNKFCKCHTDMHALTLSTKSDDNHPSRHLYIAPNLIDLQYRCGQFLMYRRSTHMSAITSHEVNIPFRINSDVLCLTSVRPNNIMNLFQGSDLTSTSILTQSQQNDGINLLEFHWTSVDLWPRHYQSSWYHQ